jgi:hypothetical protein
LYLYSLSRRERDLQREVDEMKKDGVEGSVTISTLLVNLPAATLRSPQQLAPLPFPLRPVAIRRGLTISSNQALQRKKLIHGARSGGHRRALCRTVACSTKLPKINRLGAPFWRATHHMDIKHMYIYKVSTAWRIFPKFLGCRLKS